MRIQAASSWSKGKSHDVVTEQPMLLANGRGWRGEARVGLKGGDDCDCGDCDCGNCDCGNCDCGNCDCGNCDCGSCDCGKCDCPWGACSKCCSEVCGVICSVCGEILDQVIKALQECCCECCLDCCGDFCREVFRGSNTPGIRKRYSPVPSPLHKAGDCHGYETQTECGELYIQGGSLVVLAARFPWFHLPLPVWRIPELLSWRCYGR